MSDVKVGSWVKALKPGWIGNAKFVKAGEKFQLPKDTPFSDKWMEVTDAPVTVEKTEDVKLAERVSAAQDLIQEAELDDARRGKFTFASVPRSKQGQEAHEKVEKDERASDKKTFTDAKPVFVVPESEVKAAKK